jgi:hypothetical protein
LDFVRPAMVGAQKPDQVVKQARRLAAQYRNKYQEDFMKESRTSPAYV